MNDTVSEGVLAIIDIEERTQDSTNIIEDFTDSYDSRTTLRFIHIH